VSASTLSADVLPVHVIAGPPVLAMLDGLDVAVVPSPVPGGVVLSAAPTVPQALAAAFGSERLVVMVDTFTREDVLCALRAGVSTILPAPTTTPAQLASALAAARAGDGRMPNELLVRALGGAANPGGRPAPPPQLTNRQVAVLRLMADGLGNADIARSLSCSEHTVKNVIYELMSRLNARNRAHAVASAVRHGFI
jgi:DNA-binding NarL/FixJ family response regulator